MSFNIIDFAKVFFYGNWPQSKECTIIGAIGDFASNCKASTGSQSIVSIQNHFSSQLQQHLRKLTENSAQLHKHCNLLIIETNLHHLTPRINDPTLFHFRGSQRETKVCPYLLSTEKHAVKSTFINFLLLQAFSSVGYGFVAYF